VRRRDAYTVHITTVSPVSRKTFCARVALLLFPAAAILGQSSTSSYVPGVTFQATNPNYPQPNPFYFEGRIDWNLLNISTPTNAWEFAQRGIYKQDDLGDAAGAILDYQQSIALNGLGNGTCQIVTGSVPTSGTLTPPPCMFTVRLRLAGLLQQSSPQQAIALYQEVAMIDPLRLGVHASIAETYVGKAGTETVPANATADYNQAITEYQAELALSPVTPFTTALTADLANNAHVHWGLAGIYQTLGNSAQEASELNLYLHATQWHSDTYPWRITLAKTRLAELGSATPAAKRKYPVKPKRTI
jgi:tetratricopeptide (TPR) repeat protein